MSPIARTLVNRFKEPSSWAGFASFAALVGMSTPLYAALTMSLSGACALVAFFLPEGPEGQK